MTDAPTTPPPDPAAQYDAVWDRLSADADAYRTRYPGPTPIARLVWEASCLAYARGVRDGQGAPQTVPARIVAAVMDHAARRPDDSRLAALHAFAHASQRERAAARQAAPAAKDGGNCDG